MKLTLIRHGQTDYNKNGRLVGTNNVLLNDTGRRQCKRLKMELQKKKFDICYSSPLVRCVETAMILVGDITKIEVDHRLIEREIGELEGKEKKEYDLKKYWDFKLNSNDLGVERINDLYDRIKRFLEMLKEHDDEEILIVAHTAVIRTIYDLVTKKDPLKLDIPNCNMLEIEFNK